MRHRRGKRAKVERGASWRNSLRADALEHLSNEAHVAHPLKVNSSPISLYRYKSTKAAIGFILITAGGRVSRRRQQQLNDPERNYSTTRHESPFNEGVSWLKLNLQSMGTSRLEAGRTTLTWQQQFLKVRGPIGGPQAISPSERERRRLECV